MARDLPSPLAFRHGAGCSALLLETMRARRNGRWKPRHRIYACSVLDFRLNASLPERNTTRQNIMCIEELSRIGLERCDTARCAVQTMGDLAVRTRFLLPSFVTHRQPVRPATAPPDEPRPCVSERRCNTATSTPRAAPRTSSRTSAALSASSSPTPRRRVFTTTQRRCRSSHSLALCKSAAHRRVCTAESLLRNGTTTRKRNRCGSSTS